MKNAAIKIREIEQSFPEENKQFQEGDKSGNRFQNGNKGSEMATKVLNADLAPPKEWAADLGVTAKAVLQWASGERVIPPLRLDQIIKQSKIYCMRVDAIEAEIDRMLFLQFGGHDKGLY